MKKALWYMFVGTRGGENRVRIVRSLSDQPKNANQLAEALDLDYKTVRHHLDMMSEHNIVETSGDDYAELYFLTESFEEYREEFEKIIENMDTNNEG